jgi:Rieske Fe-S protein
MAESTDRRGFLGLVIKGSAAIIGAVTLIPGIGYLLKPILAQQRARKAKVVFRNPDDANAKSFVLARYEGQEETAPGIFYKKQEDGKPFVVSSRCTHAACVVDWKEDKKKFHCACHQGWFDENGKNIEGPPDRPLDRFPAEIVNGSVIIEEPQA